MILLNFSHPLSEEQLQEIEQQTGQAVERLLELPVHFDGEKPFQEQLRALMDSLPLSTTDLQTRPLLVNLPSLNFIAALVLADLHGRMGFFPTIIRLRPLEGSLPPRYQVAELLDLRRVREQARQDAVARRKPLDDQRQR